MISVNEATKIINENLPEMSTKYLNLADSLNYVLAEDIVSPGPSPNYTNSAMDGFAVYWEDVNKASANNPVYLKLIGESRAGIPFNGKPKAGETIGISTGAMLPEGPDTVVPVEHCLVNGNSVQINQNVKNNQHVRYKGEEFNQGDLLLKQGSCLFSGNLALLAYTGQVKLSVYAPPEVAIIVTGTELKSIDEPIKDYQVRDSNSIMLQSALKSSGGKVASLHRAGDTLEETINAFKLAMKRSRMLICSGGISVGAHDHVKQAAESLGFRSLIYKIRQKPGKPFYFAKKDDILFFGLPGNPVSAFICYFHYIHPMIKKLTGSSEKKISVQGILRQNYQNKSDRSQFIFCRLQKNSQGKPFITVQEKQASHMLTSIANADGYFILAEQTSFKQNSIVEVILIKGDSGYGIY